MRVDEHLAVSRELCRSRTGSGHDASAADMNLARIRHIEQIFLILLYIDQSLDIDDRLLQRCRIRHDGVSFFSTRRIANLDRMFGRIVVLDRDAAVFAAGRKGIDAMSRSPVARDIDVNTARVLDFQFCTR